MMIGRHMPRIGQGSRVLLNACAYAFVVFAVVGGSFAGALAALPAQNGTGTQVAKIGPGYGRIRAIDFGKPDKPVYTAHSPGAHPIVIAAKRAASEATLPVFSIVAAAESPSPLVVAVAQPLYIPPDIHRIY
jgi:hypothetical protein